MFCYRCGARLSPAFKTMALGWRRLVICVVMENLFQVSFARPNRLTLEYPFTPLHSLSLNQTATKSFRFCLIDRLGNLARLSPPRRAGPLRECLCFGRGAALLGRKPAQPLPPLRRNTFWVHLKQLRQPNEIKKQQRLRAFVASAIPCSISQQNLFMSVWQHQ